jgi:hypothetical protein
MIVPLSALILPVIPPCVKGGYVNNRLINAGLIPNHGGLAFQAVFFPESLIAFAFFL